MVRPFRHPVNAADRPPSALMAERRITVKARQRGANHYFRAGFLRRSNPVSFGGMHLPVAAGRL
jgi:hypothetical protein